MWGGAWKELLKEVTDLGSEDKVGAGNLGPLGLVRHIKGISLGMLVHQHRG